MKNDTKMPSRFNPNKPYWPVNITVTTPDNTTATKCNNPTEFVGERTIMNSSYADVNSSLSASKKQSCDVCCKQCFTIFVFTRTPPNWLRVRHDITTYKHKVWEIGRQTCKQTEPYNLSHVALYNLYIIENIDNISTLIFFSISVIICAQILKTTT